MNIRLYISLLLITPILTACPVKNRAKVEHEGKREWTPQATPRDESVEESSFNKFDIKEAYAKLNGDRSQFMETILKPLSGYVLNSKFIEDPQYRTLRMTHMIQIFNAAFLTLLEAGESSSEFKDLRNRYYQTLFSGCSRDLKENCHNAELFSRDTRHTRILTFLAKEYDSRIKRELEAHKNSPILCVANSAQCRADIEERYRLLAMAVYKRNRYDDPDFAFAYLKYARVFAALISQGESAMASSYIGDSHAKIFETIIAKFQPKDPNDPEFRAFVENFNPWTYSNKQADVFQRGTRVMFNLGAQCCLYKDASKKELSEAVKEAILASQEENDSVGLPFVKMKDEIKLVPRLVENLGLSELVARIEARDGKFFNELFFVVDKLYRGHLGSSDVEMVLNNANPETVRTELPKMVADYIRINMAYMVVKTNRFMTEQVYHSGIASSEVFEHAVTRSRDLTSQWHFMQSQIELLERMMGTYFRSGRASSMDEYYKTVQLIRAVNRNIHYLSVFPNMIVMNYFLAKMKGKIIVHSWWGRFEIDADQILDAFFDGQVASPWFRFGKDAEMLTRPMLLYAWEYLLTTGALHSFTSKEGNTSTGGSEQAKFFDLIFAKYVDNDLDELRTDIADYERQTTGDARGAALKNICDYELGISRYAPNIEINFLDLHKYNYAGLDDSSIHAVLKHAVTASGRIANVIQDRLERRTIYIRVMLEILENELEKTGKKRGEPNEFTARAYENLRELESLKARLARRFLSKHQYYADCLRTIREVERRRANRIYHEERLHLGQVYDLIEPLFKIQDANELEARIKEINETHFGESKGFRFDRIEGLSYRMSKYDLFMRIKSRIERDIFANPTAREVELYGTDRVKPRPVSIFMPEGLVRDDMVAKGLSIPLHFRGDRDDFIRQGMVALNGKTGSYIDWRRFYSRSNPLRDYANTLVRFYLLGPIQDGKETYEVTKEQVTSAYLTAMADQSMDEFDVLNARDFGVDGIYDKKEVEGRIFEPDYRTRLPLFHELMKSAYSEGKLTIDKGPMYEALEFAKQLNNLQTFVFEPRTVNDLAARNGQKKDIKYVNLAVREVFREPVLRRMSRVSELFNHLSQINHLGEIGKGLARKEEASELQMKLSRPFFLEGQIEKYWYIKGDTYFLDSYKRDDLNSFIKQFTSQTNDFYRIREKVKVP